MIDTPQTDPLVRYPKQQSLKACGVSVHISISTNCDGGESAMFKGMLIEPLPRNQQLLILQRRCMWGVGNEARLSGDLELGLVDVMTLARKRDSRTFGGGCTSQHQPNNNGVQLRLHRLFEGIAKTIVFGSPGSHTC
jgi:hypothetical protein